MNQPGRVEVDEEESLALEQIIELVDGQFAGPQLGGNDHTDQETDRENRLRGHVGRHTGSREVNANQNSWSAVMRVDSMPGNEVNQLSLARGITQIDVVS